MPGERAIGVITQIPPGEGRNFDVGGLRIAVFHTRAGAVFATQAACPHKGGPLADGLTDENTVVCPLHDRAYDFRTGAALGAGLGAGLGNDCAVATYPVRIGENGTLLLTL
jgi:nitrite reductase (NADH) small subunit